MLKDIKFEELAILIDFDGTITTEDTNTKLINKYGNRISKTKEDFRDGKLTFTEYFQEEMSRVRITEAEYIDFILEEIEISPGFIKFFKKAKENNIQVGIVSGGFENGIRIFLKKYGIEDIEIFANRLIFDGDKAYIKFIDGDDANCCDKGPCGNCKIDHYYKYKENAKKIMFIGDGLTDMPVADVAEIVFAKDSLARYSDKKGIDYIKYEDFNDINRILFE